MKKYCCLAMLLLSMSVRAELVTSIEQYGITWHFEKPIHAGKFITGDWWIVGPVKVISVSPEPGAAPENNTQIHVTSRFGDLALKNDHRMRNGSMLLPTRDGEMPMKSYTNQGWDSRSPSFLSELSIDFPVSLKPGDRLLSSKSSTQNDENGAPLSPSMTGEILFPLENKNPAIRALESVAVLTCLEKAPPADSFRPPYNGFAPKIYQAKDIQWDRLQKLEPPPATPEWWTIERAYERPWFEIPSTWLIQRISPGLNQPNYGRDFNRLCAIASLMLMLDFPNEQKEKTLYGMLQLGIDLHGQVREGRQWFSDGGHWQGRKWPILFASIMLNDPGMLQFPAVNSETDLQMKKVRGSSAVPVPTTLFQEDLDTYYGLGAQEQNALWQMVWHTGPAPPYQEKSVEAYSKVDKKADHYQFNNAIGYTGIALVAGLMNAKQIWNHDAFFDYVDFWMSDDCKYAFPKWMPEGSRLVDPFVEEMWHKYRPQVPEQPGGKSNVKFVWDPDEEATGYFIHNHKNSDTLPHPEVGTGSPTGNGGIPSASD